MQLQSACVFFGAVYLFALNKKISNYDILDLFSISFFPSNRKRVCNLFLRHFCRDCPLHGLPHKTRFPASCKMQLTHSEKKNLKPSKMHIFYLKVFSCFCFYKLTFHWQVDTLDDPLRSMDVNKWNDTQLMDVSDSTAKKQNVLLLQRLSHGR